MLVQMINKRDTYLCDIYGKNGQDKETFMASMGSVNAM